MTLRRQGRSFDAGRRRKGGWEDGSGASGRFTKKRPDPEGRIHQSENHDDFQHTFWGIDARHT